MLIVPKIDENSYPISEELRDKIKDKLEIQLLGSNIELSFENVKKVVSQFRDLKVLILHMSEELVCLDFVALNDKFREPFVKLLCNLMTYANDINVDIYLLTHLMQPYRFYKNSVGKGYLKSYLKLLENSRVSILIENSLPDLRFSQPHDSALMQLLELNDTKLFMCFDICHWYSSCNLLRENLEFPKELVSRIKSVHFSATLNNDGWKNKRETHGRVHPDIESCKKDDSLFIIILFREQDIL